MNILFLNGSPRKNGYTVSAMKCIENGIDPIHTVEWVHVYDLGIKPCQSCFKCRPNKECIFPEDDGHRISRMIRSADALVIGSPTYFGNISGPLKTLIDRSLTAFEEIAISGLEAPIPLHKGKKAVMVTACATPFPISQLQNQSKGTLHAIEAILKAGGYDIAGSIVLDGASIVLDLTVSKVDIPTEIQEEAKMLGIKLQS